MSSAKHQDKNAIKTCIVEGCGADSKSCPYLFFLKVPQNPERRVDWCDAMGIAVQKGRVYCCTRHFEIPGDFDGDAPADKSSGIRLKLKSDVLPHKDIPFIHEVKNIYHLFDMMKTTGKIEKQCKYLLPAIENDLKIRIPLNIKPETLDETHEYLIAQITEYFSSNLPKSRYQLMQMLKSHRDKITEIACKKVLRGTLQGAVMLKTIQPFLQYESKACLDIPIGHKDLEQLYFVLEANQLKAYFRPVNPASPIACSDDNDFKDLFFLPGIRVNLAIPFLELSREVALNSEKFIVNTSSIPKPSDAKPNGLEWFQKVDKPYRLKSSKVGQNVTLEYLDILINLFESYEFMMSQRQRSTLICLLQQTRKDLSDYEMKELQITYCRYLSRHKYQRVINKDIAKELGDEELYMFVKEVINPEINFQFISAIDTDVASIEKIERFFRPILGYVNEQAEYTDGEPYLKFAEQLKKAITYTCQECNTTFDSPLAHLTIKEHRFCGIKKWKCVHCKASFTEAKLTGDMWSHKCS
ncbi:uncharacterized protein LOC5569111 [Aedes aegypti]|uniref:Uncharacterized protein n=1 Tax=Aedes aegypti TaxID=7159 RepID=A0A1S4FGF4_AEDAE|nr:uncharacterized protein LOC5569111 [Aedes aegypti]